MFARLNLPFIYNDAFLTGIFFSGFLGFRVGLEKTKATKIADASIFWIFGSNEPFYTEFSRL
jgi:hypothetical protein